jgi:hypothetical protein
MALVRLLLKIQQIKNLLLLDRLKISIEEVGEKGNLQIMKVSSNCWESYVL